MSVKSLHFVLGRPFQPSLVLVGNVRSPPKSGSPERCFALEGFGLSHKHEAGLERFAGDKHFRLLQTFVNYRYKNFITSDPGPNLIKIYSSAMNIRMLKVS